MSGKAFFFLVLAALALGVLAGGAMIAVLAPDDSDTQDTYPIIVAIPGPDSAGSGPQGAAPSESDLQALAQRVRSGEIDPQEMAALRQRLQGQTGGIGGDPPAGDGGALRTPGLGGGLVGVIDSLEDGAIVLSGPQSSLEATVGEDTTITIFSQGTFEDLEAGQQVMIVGEPNEDGSFKAVSVIVIPEGMAMPFGAGRGGFGGPRRGGRPPAPVMRGLPALGFVDSQLRVARKRFEVGVVMQNRRAGAYGCGGNEAVDEPADGLPLSSAAAIERGSVVIVGRQRWNHRRPRQQPTFFEGGVPVAGDAHLLDAASGADDHRLGATE